jgi:flavin reductase (DIM6/NTAB) family NADH-FMN oxidoreductase RutF
LELQDFTSREFRDAVGAFATGVSIITTSGEDHAYGMTVSSFTSVSLDPPLVLICTARNAGGSEAIVRSGVFAANILAAEQEPLSTYFASKDRARGLDAFRNIPHKTVVSGSPILDGVAGWMDCRLATTHDAGDHLIFIGEVLALGLDPGKPPLLFHRGRYANLASPA